MANQEHIGLLKRGVVQWNEWRAHYRSTLPDLRRARLNRVDLSRANLSGADLTGANLSYADLQGADLVSACLRDADLSHTNLITTRLRHADLSHADLSFANLSNADLSFAQLIGANFHAARFGFTVFAWIDLRTVKELDTTTHEGPSALDIQSVKLPESPIRTRFLQNVGFSDTFIDYLPSLFATAIQYYSCFISYAHQDQAQAQRLHANLQAKGVRCWFAPEDLKIGDRIRSCVDQAIHLQEKLLLLLSEHAIKSDWVEDEVETALEKEKRQQCEVLFPILLDNSVMETDHAWAAKLRRTRYIGDFTNWTDPKAYQQAFDHLLRDLKKADEQKREEGGN